MEMRREAKTSEKKLEKRSNGYRTVKTKFVPPDHPAIIITSQINAPHINQLKDQLSENFIKIMMQSSLNKLNKPQGIPKDKFFLIVDNKKGPVQLSGQFSELKKQKYCRVDYPRKHSLDKVIKKYDQFIGLGKQKKEVYEGAYFQDGCYELKDNEIDLLQRVRTGYQSRLGKQQKRQLRLKSISVNEETDDNNSGKKKLFILENEHQSEHYLRYLRTFRNIKNKDIVIVNSIDEYLRLSYKSGEGSNYLLVGQNAAKSDLHRFNEVKKIFLYGTDKMKCSKTQDRNIKKIAFQGENMDEVLIQEGFQLKGKGKAYKLKKGIHWQGTQKQFNDENSEHDDNKNRIVLNHKTSSRPQISGCEEKQTSEISEGDYKYEEHQSEELSKSSQKISQFEITQKQLPLLTKKQDENFLKKQEKQQEDSTEKQSEEGMKQKTKTKNKQLAADELISKPKQSRKSIVKQKKKNSIKKLNLKIPSLNEFRTSEKSFFKGIKVPQKNIVKKSVLNEQARVNADKNGKKGQFIVPQEIKVSESPRWNNKPKMVSISTQYEDFSEYYGLSRIPITSTISNYRNSYNNSRESSKETKYYNRTFHDIDLSKYDKIFENGLVYYKPKVALRPEKPTSQIMDYDSYIQQKQNSRAQFLPKIQHELKYPQNRMKTHYIKEKHLPFQQYDNNRVYVTQFPSQMSILQENNKKKFLKENLPTRNNFREKQTRIYSLGNERQRQRDQQMREIQQQRQKQRQKIKFLKGKSIQNNHLQRQQSNFPQKNEYYTRKITTPSVRQQDVPSMPTNSQLFRTNSQYKNRSQKLSSFGQDKKRQQDYRKFPTSYINKPPQKDESVLYLIQNKLPPHQVQKVEKIPDSNDKVYVFSNPKQLQRQVKMGREAFDLVLVFLKDSKTISPSLNSKNCFVVKEKPNLDNQIQTSDNLLFLNSYQKLPQNFHKLLNRSKEKRQRQNRVSHVYYKDFNRSIYKFSEVLKKNFPYSQCRKYFGIQDLPTTLPSFNENDFVIMLIDEVGFKEIQAYCNEQVKNKIKVIMICVPKSKEFGKLCKRQKESNPVIWLTEKQLVDTKFILKRIKNYMQELTIKQ